MIKFFKFGFEFNLFGRHFECRMNGIDQYRFLVMIYQEHRYGDVCVYSNQYASYKSALKAAREMIVEIAHSDKGITYYYEVSDCSRIYESSIDYCTVMKSEVIVSEYVNKTW